MSIHLFLFAVSLSLVAGSSWERTVLSCTVQRALLAPASAADLAGGSSTSQRTRQPLYRSDITIFYSGTHFLLTSPCLLCRSSTRRTVLQSFCIILYHSTTSRVSTVSCARVRSITRMQRFLLRPYAIGHTLQYVLGPEY
jgi:hypothetical protein